MSSLLGIAAFALVAASGYLWFQKAFALSLPEDRTRFVWVFAAGAVLGAVALMQGAGWFAGTAAALAILGGAFFCFTIAISRQVVAPGSIMVGSKLPEFSAPDENGEIFESSSLAGRPVLIKFFRGHW